MFEQILDQEAALSYLRRALAENTLPETLLFYGSEGVGKRTVALELATHLLRTSMNRLDHHPDFHLLQPEGKSGLHTIDTLREAIDLSHEAPFEAPSKVFLIDAAERMQPAASNALLKSLEEPAPNTYWILLTSSLHQILPTILSRCAKISFQPLAISAIETLLQSRGHPTELAPLAAGSMSKALELVQHPELDEARKLLFALLDNIYDYPQLTKSLESIDKLLETEDPLLKNRRAEYLFQSIALYFRDRELTQIDSASPYRFFSSISGAPIPNHWEEPFDQARTAFERNIKLSTCLEALFLSL